MLCGKPRNMPPPLYAERCSPAPAHTRLTLAAPNTQRLSLGGGVETDGVHINYVVT